LLDTLKLDSGWSHELLLFGTHLLVLSRGGYWVQPLPGEPAAMIAPQASSSTLTEVDVSDPAALKVVQTLTLDGAYLDARMIGGTVRVVSSNSMPIELPYVTPSGATTQALAAAVAKNRAVVASSRLSAWLPTYRLGTEPARPLVSCRDVRRPPIFSGLGMLTVTTIDLAKGLAPVDSTAVMTDGRIVYASPTSLYVATEQWSARPLPAAPTEAPSAGTTQIHAFDISDPAKTTYLGSGTVPGYLLSQWSLSAFQGVLRVVSTDTPTWWGTGPASQSYLTTLRPQNGGLVQVGQVGGLGRGDRVYAVRMIGDTGYVVTFKQVDPLYTIDLHDPAHPQLLGALDLPGYSSYLQPISDNLLLGIGQSVNPQTNEPAGTQVSSSTSPTPGTRPASTRRRSAKAGRWPSPTTTPSSTGPRPDSSSCPSDSRRSQCTSPAPPASLNSGASSTTRRASPSCRRSTVRSSSERRSSPSRAQASPQTGSRAWQASAGRHSRRHRRPRHRYHSQEGKSRRRRSVPPSSPASPRCSRVGPLDVLGIGSNRGGR
jgi:Beta propeller domain